MVGQSFDKKQSFRAKTAGVLCVLASIATIVTFIMGFVDRFSDSDTITPPEIVSVDASGILVAALNITDVSLETIIAIMTHHYSTPEEAMYDFEIATAGMPRWSSDIVRTTISDRLYEYWRDNEKSNDRGGWGPERETFTMEVPAPHITFNSITDNPAIGDERNFVRIREAGVGTFRSEIELIPGREYEVVIFYHNNAACNLNPTGEGIAQNVRMRSRFPETVSPGERAMISGEVSSPSANPVSVWDHAYVTSTSVVALRYIAASAIIHNSGASSGRILSTELFSNTGVLLGFNELNGLLPGCAEFAGRVVYRLAVVQPNFEREKTVSTYSTRDWRGQIQSQPGDTVEFRLHYRNTGQVDQVDVTLLDTLPHGLAFIPGSTRLYNNADPAGSYIVDGITTTGINIGLYGPGAEATITYRVRIASHTEMPYGTRTLLSPVAAITGNGTRYADVEIIVTNEPRGFFGIFIAVPLWSITIVTVLLAVAMGAVYWYKKRQQSKRS
jgi:uncharacterized repeat protein (TIGR01451 family)